MAQGTTQKVADSTLVTGNTEFIRDLKRGAIKESELISYFKSQAESIEDMAGKLNKNNKSAESINEVNKETIFLFTLVATAKEYGMLDKESSPGIREMLSKLNGKIEEAADSIGLEPKKVSVKPLGSTDDKAKEAISKYLNGDMDASKELHKEFRSHHTHGGKTADYVLGEDEFGRRMENAREMLKNAINTEPFKSNRDREEDKAETITSTEKGSGASGGATKKEEPKRYTYESGIDGIEKDIATYGNVGMSRNGKAIRGGMRNDLIAADEIRTRKVTRIMDGTLEELANTIDTVAKNPVYKAGEKEELFELKEIITGFLKEGKVPEELLPMIKKEEGKFEDIINSNDLKKGKGKLNDMVAMYYFHAEVLRDALEGRSNLNSIRELSGVASGFKEAQEKVTMLKNGRSHAIFNNPEKAEEKAAEGVDSLRKRMDDVINEACTLMAERLMVELRTKVENASVEGYNASDAKAKMLGSIKKWDAEELGEKAQAT